MKTEYVNLGITEFPTSVACNEFSNKPDIVVTGSKKGPEKDVIVGLLGDK